MNNKLWLMGFYIVFVLIGCASADFELVGDAKYPPYSENCKFDIITTKISEPYEEIGVVSFDNYGMGDCSNSIKDVRKNAAKHVCKSGGNAIVLWEVNPKGCYIKGTVIRTKNTK